MARRSAKQTAKREQRKPRPRKRIANVRPWNWADVIWVGASLLVASVLTVLVLGNQLTALMPDAGIVGVRAILLVFFYLMILAILAYRAHSRNLNFSEAYYLRKGAREIAGTQQKQQGLPAWKSGLLVVGLFFVLRLFVVIYAYTIEQMGWAVHPPERLTDLFGTTMLGLIAAIVSIVILAPFIEELVFRVIMFEKFAQKMPYVAAAIVQAIIFGVYHFSLWQALPSALLGIACAYLALRSRTIIPAIALHVLYNAAPVAAAFYLAI
ncbi:MAG: CPBP family intramembrane metalloprotease [Coriobacteriia bacterium]|nr:CPBP family intramembrane metalloprotease [Coriobacteriia bacterium]